MSGRGVITADGVEHQLDVVIPGPNTPIGNYSVIAMDEVQSQYVLKLIGQWRNGYLATVEATDGFTCPSSREISDSATGKAH